MPPPGTHRRGVGTRIVRGVTSLLVVGVVKTATHVLAAVLGALLAAWVLTQSSFGIELASRLSNPESYSSSNCTALNVELEAISTRLASHPTPRPAPTSDPLSIRQTSSSPAPQVKVAENKTGMVDSSTTVARLVAPHLIKPSVTGESVQPKISVLAMRFLPALAREMASQTLWARSNSSSAATKGDDAHMPVQVCFVKPQERAPVNVESVSSGLHIHCLSKISVERV